MYFICTNPGRDPRRKRLRHICTVAFFLAIVIVLLRDDFYFPRTLFQQPHYSEEVKRTAVAYSGGELENNDSNTDNNVHKFEKHHIAFLKVHKAASSTVQNIFYRFGSQRNLSFVLPYTTHYISQYSAEKYNPILPPLDNQTRKYDLLCNHVIFNHTNFKQLMYDDVTYLAIVRNPLDLFISAAYYYKYTWPAPYLTALNDTTFIQDLIRRPEELEPHQPRHSRTFNIMAKDFGFSMPSVRETLKLNDTILASFVSDLKNIFHFVMIVEYFDESLVIMKRLLDWSLKDILYIKVNEFKPKRGVSTTKRDVSEEDKVRFRNRNRVDYAIYNTFLEMFVKRRSEERGLDEEVSQFRRALDMVHSFCTNETSVVNKFVFPSTTWNTMFSVVKQDCKPMMTPELTLWRKMIQKHNSLLKR